MATQAELEQQLAESRAREAALTKKSSEDNWFDRAQDGVDKLNKGRSWISSIFGAVGDFFGFAVPTAIFGGLFLAIAPLISSFLPDDWKEPFDGIVAGVKNTINGFLPDGVQIPYNENDLKALKAQVTPEAVRKALTEKEVGLTPAQAAAIVPNDAAVTEVSNFVKKQGVPNGLIDRAGASKKLREPATLAKFIEQHPNTMLRLAGTLTKSSSASASSVPPVIKSALDVILGDTARATKLMNNEQHQQWVQLAAEKLSGRTSKTVQVIFDEATTTEEITLLQLSLNGHVAAADKLATEIFDRADQAEKAKVQKDGEHELNRDQSNDPNNLVYEAKEAEYKKMLEQGGAASVILKAMEFDATFKQAIIDLPSSLEKQSREMKVLELVLAKPERINALKELEPTQLTPVLSALKMPNTIELPLNGKQIVIPLEQLMATKSTRGAAIDLLADLQRTNNNVTIAGLLAKENRAEAFLNYMNDDVAGPARKDAVLAFANKLNPTHAESVTSGLPAAARQNYQKIAADMHAAMQQVAEVGEQVQNVAPVIEALSENQELAKILGVNIENGKLAIAQDLPAAIQRVLTDDRTRYWLGQSSNDPSADGRMNLYLLGDLLRESFSGQLAEKPMLKMLLTPKTVGTQTTYPNLDALMQAASQIDRASGVNEARLEVAFKSLYPGISDEALALILLDPLTFIEQEAKNVEGRKGEYAKLTEASAKSIMGTLNRLGKTVNEEHAKESGADAKNLQMLDVIAASASGDVAVTETTEWVDNGGMYYEDRMQFHSVINREYIAQTALHGDVAFSPKEVSNYLNGDDNQTLEALGKFFNALQLPEGSNQQQMVEQIKWNDVNNNDRIDEGESLLNVARDHKFLGKVIRQNQDPSLDLIGWFDRSRSEVDGSDLTKLATLGKLKAESVDHDEEALVQNTLPQNLQAGVVNTK